ncbi:MAG: zeta toxin family protein [Planctomycetes bacterium]|nr:zeta toxin family protein [Planctomycetota bacterium]
MTTDHQPTCYIIAGPNGAGKTTYAFKFLPEVADCSLFVNADLIAAGLSPLSPQSQNMVASRLFFKEIEKHIKAKHDFAFETTLSGRGYLRLIHRLHRAGWLVKMDYLALPTVEMSLLRVAERVAHGGHSIPEVDIRRRFPRSLHNLLHIYSHVVDYARCFLNAGASPILVFTQQAEQRTIFSQDSYSQIFKEAAYDDSIGK